MGLFERNHSDLKKCSEVKKINMQEQETEAKMHKTKASKLIS